MQNRKQAVCTRTTSSTKQNDSKLRSNNSNSTKPTVFQRQAYCSPKNETSSMICKNCRNGEQSPMIQVLLDENANLKQQNNFLQDKLDRMIKNERDMNAALKEYEQIIFTLNNKNVEIHRTIKQCTDKVNSKFSKLKPTMNEKLRERRCYERETAPIGDYDNNNQFSSKPFSNKQNIAYLKCNLSEKSKFFQTINNQCKKKQSLDMNLIPKESLSFDMLLERCQNETDMERRKYYRKKLVDFTYQKSAVIGYLS